MRLVPSTLWCDRSAVLGYWLAFESQRVHFAALNSPAWGPPVGGVVASGASFYNLQFTITVVVLTRGLPIRFSFYLYLVTFLT